MKRLFNLVSLALCACLFGCAASGPFKSKMEPDPVMAGLDEKIDVSEHVKLSLDQNCAKLGAALQGNVKISEQGRLAVYAHCATLCDAQIEAKDADGKISVCGGEGGNPWLAKVADQSFKQIRRSCDIWFNVLEKQRVEIQYNQTNANVGAGAIATVLAAAGGHTRAVFNLATTTTLGNAMVENYKASFIFSPELGKLHDKINSELFDAKQQAILGKLGSGGYQSWGQLVSDIADFEELCSHKKVVEVINKSIDFAKFTFAPVGISVEAQNTANDLKKSIRDALKVETLSDSEFMDLAALAELSRDKRKNVIDYLGAKTGDKDNATLLDGDKSVLISALLKNATTLKLGESDDQLRTLQRLAETMKWIGTSDFITRLANNEAWAAKGAALVQTAHAEAQPQPSGANPATPAARNNQPLRFFSATRPVPAITTTAAKKSTLPPLSASEKEMAKIFRKPPPVPSQLLSNQIIAVPK